MMADWSGSLVDYELLLGLQANHVGISLLAVEHYPVHRRLTQVYIKNKLLSTTLITSCDTMLPSTEYTGQYSNP